MPRFVINRLAIHSQPNIKAEKGLCFSDGSDKLEVRAKAYQLFSAQYHRRKSLDSPGLESAPARQSVETQRPNSTLH